MIKDDDYFDNTSEDEIETEVCPKCEKPLIIKWSGVKCSSCDY